MSKSFCVSGIPNLTTEQMVDALDAPLDSDTAAQVAGSRMRAAGWSVGLVDHRLFDGTCALCGCGSEEDTNQAGWGH
jgi:hypothetical protein